MDDGNGWWLASDGRWYPPETRPAPVPPSPPGRWYRAPVKVWLATCSAMVLILVGAGVGLLLAGDAPASLTANTLPLGSGPSITVPHQVPAIPTTAPAGLPPPTGELVTPAVEQAVIQNTWVPFADAFSEDNTPVMQQLTTPAVYRAIVGSYYCGCRPWAATYKTVAYDAAPQTSYPIEFWAELVGQDYNGETITKEAVFSQASASSPWLVADVGAFWGGTPVLVPGQNVLLAPPPSVPESVSSVANQFAQYFHALDTTGSATLPPDFVDDEQLQELTAGSTSTYQDLTGQRWAVDDAHAVTATGNPFALPPSDGQGVMACFDLTHTETVTGAANDPVVQPPDQSLFTRLLAAGNYSSVTLSSLFDVCFTETAGGSVIVVTNEGGFVSVVGTPA